MSSEAGDAEIVIETNAVGPPAAGWVKSTSQPSDLLDGVAKRALFRFSHPVHAEVPLSDAGRVVTALAEQLGDGQPPRLDESREAPGLRSEAPRPPIAAR